MAGARIELQLDVGEASAALNDAAAKLSPEGSRLLLSDIGEYLLRSTRDRGDHEVDPDGRRWRALEPSYRRWKAKKRPGVPILKFDHHMLGDQLSWQLDGDTAVLVGTNAIYGAVHQFGSRDPNRGIPARPWLGISATDADEIVALTRDHLLAAFSGPAA
ncbi:phage virion morphogenesis protein [Rhodanobacter denitrificans]|uniref:Phage virion morphogenesis protein, putative tail completion n=1 Tax=Rhodanobacter denitrificans TaxID=666685 RepID=M4NG46_9GAMM|nr:phage virion morphogenesis protein [Rhodanobacter denitrificans]AGG89920.1 phage virion morphogenesis protein, putative tail completion [Rhodanobacter denitrificans]UJM85316.1 phage virion morphogenesis protein [Rhodanobacter denitrificans]